MLKYTLARQILFAYLEGSTDSSVGTSVPITLYLLKADLLGEQFFFLLASLSPSY